MTQLCREWADWHLTRDDGEGYSSSTTIGRLADGLVSAPDFGSKPPTYQRARREERTDITLRSMPADWGLVVMAHFLWRTDSPPVRWGKLQITEATYRRRFDQGIAWLMGRLGYDD